MNKYQKKLLAGCLAVGFLITTVITPNVFAATSKTQSVATRSISSEHRLSGVDRYETAAKIAQEGWRGTSEYAVLSAGMNENLVDALAAAPLAKLRNAPILLTQGDALNRYAETELEANGLNPYKYLCFIFKELPGVQFGQHPEFLEDYLPWSPEVQAVCK